MSGYDSNTLLYMPFDYVLSVDRAQSLNRKFQSSFVSVNRNSSNDKKKFGNSSLEFTGVSPQSYNSTEALTIPRDSFSVDFWYYVGSNSTGNPYLIQFAYADESKRPTVSGESDPRDNFLSVRYNLSDNKIEVLFYKKEIQSFESSTNGWHHFLFQYKDTTTRYFYLFHDGVLQRSIKTDQIPASTSVNITIHDNSSALSGYFDELRVQRGLNYQQSFDVPSVQYSAEINTYDLGTIPSGFSVDLTAVADGMNFEYSTTTVTETDPETGEEVELVKPYIGSGKSVLNTPAGLAETKMTFTPSSNMDLEISYSLTSTGACNYCYVTLEEQNTETTLLEDGTTSETVKTATINILDKASGTMSETKITRIKKGALYTLTLRQIGESTTTDSRTNSMPIHSFKIFEILTQQIIMKYNYGFIQENYTFNLQQISDNVHYTYDAENERLVSGDTSYGIAAGASVVFFKFIPAYKGVLTVNCQIDSRKSYNFGGVTLSPAQQFNSETQKIEELDPPMPNNNQLKNKTVSVLNGGSYVVSISGTVAAKDYTSIEIESGTPYWVGIHYLKSTNSSMGIDRFYVQGISYTRTSTDAEYVSFPDSSGKIKSFPVNNNNDDADLEVYIVKDGVVKKGGLVAANSSNSTALKTIGRGTSATYGFLRDLVEEVEEPSIANQTNVYTGKEISAIWNNFDPDTMYVSGDLSGINSDNYAAFIGLKDRESHRWAGKTSANQVKTWKITAAPSVISCVNEAEIDIDHYAMITVDRTQNTLTSVKATSSNEQVATVSVSSQYKVSIKGVSLGQATITVSQNPKIDSDDETGKTYTNVTQSQELKIKVLVLPKIYHIPEIYTMLENGTIQNQFSVGDQIYLKLNSFTLQGSGDSEYTIEPHIVYATIIGYNHNPDIEGSISVHFQLGSLDTSGVSLIAYAYGSMNKTNTFDGGWLSSNMRNVNMPAIRSALPHDKYYKNATSSENNYWDTHSSVYTFKYVNSTGSGNGPDDHVQSFERCDAHSRDFSRELASPVKLRNKLNYTRYSAYSESCA